MDSDPIDWTDLGTAAISDALDRFGLRGPCPGLAPLDASSALAGPAFTVRMAPAAKRTVGDYIDRVPAGAVVVIDNRGRLEETVWGDLLTRAAVRRGIAGTVIDGVCRDSASITGSGYPLFSRGRFMRTGKDRVQLEAVEDPVTLAGVRVEPGDLVVGDADGVVVVPQARTDAVLAAAREIATAEDLARRALEEGVPLAEARRSVGYHRLQARKGGDGQ